MLTTIWLIVFDWWMWMWMWMCLCHSGCFSSSSSIHSTGDFKNPFATFIDAQHRFNYAHRSSGRKRFFLSFLVCQFSDRNMTQFVIFNLLNYHKMRATQFIFFGHAGCGCRLLLYMLLLFFPNDLSCLPAKLLDYPMNLLWEDVRFFSHRGWVEKPQDLRPVRP